MNQDILLGAPGGCCCCSRVSSLRSLTGRTARSHKVEECIEVAVLSSLTLLTFLVRLLRTDGFFEITCQTCQRLCVLEAPQTSAGAQRNTFC